MNIKNALAITSLGAAIGFGIAGTAIDPAGVIDSSLLYLIAQFILYSATLVGFGNVISKVIDLIVDMRTGKRSK